MIVAAAGDNAPHMARVLLRIAIPLLAATLAWMAWFLARGERERDPLLRAWHRLDARYARLGLGREPHETAGDWARRVAARRPQGANLLFSLSRRFAAARYAPDEGDQRALIEDLRRHRP